MRLGDGFAKADRLPKTINAHCNVGLIAFFKSGKNVPRGVQHIAEQAHPIHNFRWLVTKPRQVVQHLLYIVFVEHNHLRRQTVEIVRRLGQCKLNINQSAGNYRRLNTGFLTKKVDVIRDDLSNALIDAVLLVLPCLQLADDMDQVALPYVIG